MLNDRTTQSHLDGRCSCPWLRLPSLHHTHPTKMTSPESAKVLESLAHASLNDDGRHEESDSDSSLCVVIDNPRAAACAFGEQPCAADNGRQEESDSDSSLCAVIEDLRTAARAFGEPRSAAGSTLESAIPIDSSFDSDGDEASSNPWMHATDAVVPYRHTSFEPTQRNKRQQAKTIRRAPVLWSKLGDDDSTATQNDSERMVAANKRGTLKEGDVLRFKLGDDDSKVTENESARIVGVEALEEGDATRVHATGSAVPPAEFNFFRSLEDDSFAALKDDSDTEDQPAAPPQPELGDWLPFVDDLSRKAFDPSTNLPTWEFTVHGEDECKYWKGRRIVVL
jgi:hypothetical protein